MKESRTSQQYCMPAPIKKVEIATFTLQGILEKRTHENTNVNNAEAPLEEPNAPVQLCFETKQSREVKDFYPMQKTFLQRPQLQPGKVGYKKISKTKVARLADQRYHLVHRGTLENVEKPHMGEGFWTDSHAIKPNRDSYKVSSCVLRDETRRRAVSAIVKPSVNLPHSPLPAKRSLSVASRALQRNSNSAPMTGSRIRQADYCFHVDPDDPDAINPTLMKQILEEVVKDGRDSGKNSKSASGELSSFLTIKPAATNAAAKPDCILCRNRGMKIEDLTIPSVADLQVCDHEKKESRLNAEIHPESADVVNPTTEHSATSESESNSHHVPNFTSMKTAPPRAWISSVSTNRGSTRTKSVNFKQLSPVNYGQHTKPPDDDSRKLNGADLSKENFPFQNLFDIKIPSQNGDTDSAGESANKADVTKEHNGNAFWPLTSPGLSRKIPNGGTENFQLRSNTGNTPRDRSRVSYSPPPNKSRISRSASMSAKDHSSKPNVKMNRTQEKSRLSLNKNGSSDQEKSRRSQNRSEHTNADRPNGDAVALVKINRVSQSRVIFSRPTSSRPEVPFNTPSSSVFDLGGSSVTN